MRSPTQHRRLLLPSLSIRASVLVVVFLLSFVQSSLVVRSTLANDPTNSAIATDPHVPKDSNANIKDNSTPKEYHPNIDSIMDPPDPNDYPEASIDAIVIGSGLAGLTTALTILDAGGRVWILEKEAKLGGNSMKASSGINVCRVTESDQTSFREDTLNSAGQSGDATLMEQLVQHSDESILVWLQKRLDVDLSQVAQLGGHSQARTYRPSGKLPVGAEIMTKLQKAVRSFQEGGKVTICSPAKATQLSIDKASGRVTGVIYESTAQDGSLETKEVRASNVVLATGGFAADRSSSSWLAKVRPELLNLGATAGEFSTGDGLSLATSIQADLVDMHHVQVHPTGFIDPKDPDNPNKFLAAEVLRGVGGILLNTQGKRFCNEIGRRDYVTDELFSLNDSYAKTRSWMADQKAPQVFLLLSEESAHSVASHVGFYEWKGFLSKLTGMSAVAEYMGVSEDALRTTLSDYATAARNGVDQFGKNLFMGVPDLEKEKVVLYVGKVEPVLHYCMGGIKINSQGQVLSSNDAGTPIISLYACGEVSGGIHGENRLAGNSLCECVVFGRIIGKAILVASTS